MDRVIFFVNKISFFNSHRSHLIDDLKNLGFYPIVNGIGKSDHILRGHKSYFSLIVSFFEKFYNKNLIRVYISPKVIILSFIAQVFFKRNIIMITGGYLYQSAPKYMRKLYFFTLRFYGYMGSTFIVQNEHDMNALSRIGKTYLLRGTGVKTFSDVSKVKQEKVVFLMVSRLLRDKGVIEYIEACCTLSPKFNVEFILVGDEYKENPMALTVNEIEVLKRSDVKWFKEMTNEEILDLLRSSTTYGVLPSYREGMSRFLIESMSMAVPVITTNAIGCTDFKTFNCGLFCESQSSASLTSVLEKAILIPDLEYEIMSKNALEESRKHFDSYKVALKLSRILNLC